MIRSFQDQVCIVTGSSSGIGEGFAKVLAQRAARVVLFARRQARLEALAGQLPGDPLVVVGDVTRAADREALVQRTLDRWGRIDVLINNAGADDRMRFLDMSPSDVERILLVNLVSPVMLSHAVAPSMVERGHGLIINVSSAMGDINAPRATVYGTTKAGLSAFSLALFRGLQRHGVHVMNFVPGYTRSGMIPASADRKLPPFVKVHAATDAARRALDAALRGKPVYVDGEWVIRLFMLFNRVMPRLADIVVRRIWGT